VIVLSINFSYDRWEKVKETYKEWWDGRLVRPIIPFEIKPITEVQINNNTVPLFSQKTCHMLQYSADEIVGRIDESLSDVSSQGIPDLHELKDSGNWNWDTFLEIGINTTRDFNGDGFVDQWGLVADPINLGLSLVVSNGSDYVLETEDSIRFNLEQPNALRALQFYSDIFNVYKITPYNTLWKTAQQIFAGNKAAMAVREGWAAKTDFIPFNVNFGFEILPKGPDVNEYKGLSLGGGFQVFPADIEDPENVVKAFAEFWAWWDVTKPGYMLSSDIVRSWGRSNTLTERDLQSYIEASSIQVVSRARHFPEMNTLISSQILNKIATMEKSVISAVDAVKQGAQVAIDNRMVQ
jgi:maltose-binding protein MalE